MIQVRKEKLLQKVSLHLGALGFSSPTLSVPNVISKDVEHKPNHYLVLIPRDDTNPAHVSFWEDSAIPITLNQEKSLWLEVRSHLKSAERGKCDERMKFLGLSELLKTITVKLTTFLLPSPSLLTVLIGNAIRSFLPHLLLEHEVAY